MNVNINQKGSSLGIILSCIGLGLFSDYLFFGKQYGISYPLFLLIVYGVFIYTFRGKMRFRGDFGSWLYLPIILLSLSFLLFSNTFFYAVNMLVLPILFIMQTVLLTRAHQHRWHSPAFVKDLCKILFDALRNVVVPFFIIKNAFRSHLRSQTTTVLIKVLIGLALALPLLLIVTFLLSSADQIFDHLLSQFPEWMRKIDLGNLPVRIIHGLFYFFAFFCYIWALYKPRTRKQKEVAEQGEIGHSFQIDGVISITILSVINLIYTIFTVIQIPYLIGKASSFLPPGVTYSEYAKQGFSQIVIVTIINLVVLLIFMLLVSQKQPRLYHSVKLLLSWLTICTIIMLCSAFFRLYMYENAYGFTLFRLLAHAFMILLAIWLIIALIKIWRKDFSLIRAYVIVVIAWYVILNYLNLDVIIAKTNIARYETTGKIDVEYLGTLSYDVVPELNRIDKGKIKATVDSVLYRKYALTTGEKHWQSFNLSEYRAKKLLKQKFH
jgi:hypothetical protein